MEAQKKAPNESSVQRPRFHPYNFKPRAQLVCTLNSKKSCNYILEHGAREKEVLMGWNPAEMMCLSPANVIGTLDGQE